MIERPNCALYFLAGFEKKFLHKKVYIYLHGIFNDINEQDTSFLGGVNTLVFLVLSHFFRDGMSPFNAKIMIIFTFRYNDFFYIITFVIRFLDVTKRRAFESFCQGSGTQRITSIKYDIYSCTVRPTAAGILDFHSLWDMYYCTYRAALIWDLVHNPLHGHS